MKTKTNLNYFFKYSHNICIDSSYPQHHLKQRSVTETPGFSLSDIRDDSNLNLTLYNLAINLLTGTMSSPVKGTVSVI